MGREPGFAWFYFVNEHLMRLVAQRVPLDYHTGPWWYFLPRVGAYVFPWILLVGMPLQRDARSTPRERHARRLLWIAFLVPFAIFSLSRAKGDYYMLVGVPPLILLIADRVARMDRRAPVLVVAPAAWLVLLAYVAQTTTEPGIWPYRLPPYAGALVLGSGLVAAAAVIAALRLRHRTGIALSAVALLPGVLLFSSFLTVNEPYKSAHSLAAAVRQLGMDEVYVYRQYEDLSALAYCLDAPVGVVASLSADLWYGMQLAPDHDRFPTVPAFLDKLDDASVVLIVEERDLRSFRHLALAETLQPSGAMGPYRLFRSMPEIPQLLATYRSRR